jgi:hypothetical protein
MTANMCARCESEPRTVSKRSGVTEGSSAASSARFTRLAPSMSPTATGRSSSARNPADTSTGSPRAAASGAKPAWLRTPNRQANAA